jgi:hypothetical protein
MADVEYRALTGTGKMRHPSFKGDRVAARISGKLLGAEQPASRVPEARHNTTP